MRRHNLRRHLSFANVCSALALFIALSGGVAWAATELSKNSVRAKHIAPKQVRAKHISSGAVKARHLAKSLRGGKGGQGLRGPQGPRGPKGDRGAAGEKGSLDGILMGRGPLTRHATSPSPYPEIPLGSVNEFTIYANCVDSPYPSVRVYVRASRAGGTVLGGTSTVGGQKFTMPGQAQFFLLETTQNPYVSKRYAQYAFTLISANGEIHDVRGIAYVQRSEDQSPHMEPGRACGFNQASFLKVSR